jgi:hypothetical protein
MVCLQRDTDRKMWVEVDILNVYTQSLKLSYRSKLAPLPWFLLDHAFVLIISFRPATINSCSGSCVLHRPFIFSLLNLFVDVLAWLSVTFFSFFSVANNG